VLLALGDVDESEHHAVDDVVRRAVRTHAQQVDRAVGTALQDALDHGERAQDLLHVLLELGVGDARGDLGDRAAVVAFAQVEQVADRRGETADVQGRIEEERRDLRAFEQVLQVAVEAGEGFVLAVELDVDRLQFLVDGLHFLLGGLQFLVRGLQLLVGRLHFLVGGFQFVDRGVQLFARGRQFPFELLHAARIAARGAGRRDLGSYRCMCRQVLEHQQAQLRHAGNARQTDGRRRP
jgi:hypothetical protein